MFSMDCTCSFLTRFISRSAASILQDEYRCSRGFVSCFLMYSYYHSMLFLSSIFLIFLYFLMGILFIMHIFDILYKHYKHFTTIRHKPINRFDCQGQILIRQGTVLCLKTKKIRQRTVPCLIFVFILRCNL